MHKSKISSKQSISSKQPVKKNTNIYDNYTLLRRTVLSLVEENKKLMNRIETLEKVFIEKKDEIINKPILKEDSINFIQPVLNEFQNINIINGTCNDINDSSQDNSIVNKKYIDSYINLLNNNFEVKYNSLINIKKTDNDVNLLQNLANELMKLQQGIQDIQKINTFDNTKTLELFTAEPSIITQNNINIGYNPKNKLSSITLNAANGDINCSSINKTSGNLSIGKNIVLNYNGNIKCNCIYTIGDINTTKNIIVKDCIKCNNIMLLNNNKIVINHLGDIDCNNILCKSINIKTGLIEEVNNNDPKSIVNIEYLDNLPRIYFAELIIENIENDKYNKDDFILYQNKTTFAYTLMKFDGTTFNKVNVKNGSICIVNNTQDIFIKLKDFNENQNWSSYTTKNIDEIQQ